MDLQIKPDDQRLEILMRDLNENCIHAGLVGPQEVPWFPITEQDVDEIATLVLVTGEEADHPGFKDEEYRRRRAVIADAAFRYRLGEAIEDIDYTHDEVNCWTVIWDRLMDLLPKHACDEYLSALELMKKEAG